MENFLEVKDLTISVKNKKLLDSINFNVDQGDIIGLMGPSGSGKSVFMKSMVGLFKLERGSILINGQKISKKDIGYATQEDSIYEDLTIQENLFYFGRLFGLNGKIIKNKIDQLLPLLGLQDFRNYLVKHLSGGMKKRVNVACSLIHDPKILLLDEPTSGLDPLMRENLLSLIEKIRNKGTTVLITSHFIDEIEDFCNKIGVINQGKLLDFDSVEVLKNKYSKYYNVLISANPIYYETIYSNLSQRLSVINAKVENNKLNIHVEKVGTISQYNSLISKILIDSKINIFNIGIREESLEEVFRYLIKNGTH